MLQALFESAAADPNSKRASAMPLKYIQLASSVKVASNPSSYSQSGLTSDAIPDRIEGAIAPQSIVSVPGKLVQLHLPGADIRYMSGCFGNRESEGFLNLLESHRTHSHRDWERFGKGRLVVQWSQPAGMRYVFSDAEYIAHSFPAFVNVIRARVVEILAPIYGVDKTAFNYCVCNCYQTGLAGVNWHTDSEAHIVPGTPIACVSFGSERVFSLAKIPPSVTAPIASAINVRLQTGSLIVMAGETQTNYFHAISKEALVREPRFSLTFRVNYVL